MLGGEKGMKMYSMKVRDLPVRQVLFLVFLKNLCSDIYRMDSNPSNPILEKILPSTANNANHLSESISI